MNDVLMYNKFLVYYKAKILCLNRNFKKKIYCWVNFNNRQVKSSNSKELKKF